MTRKQRWVKIRGWRPGKVISDQSYICASFWQTLAKTASTRERPDRFCES